MTPSEHDANWDLLSTFFGAPRAAEPTTGPCPRVADVCRQSSAGALKVSPNHTDRELGALLERAAMVLTVAGPDRSVVASVMVEPGRLAFARQQVDRVEGELAAVVAHHGWRLDGVHFIAAATTVPAAPTAPPKRLELVAQIAGTIAELKCYDVRAFCGRVGIPPSPYPDADPCKSKAGYVKPCLDKLELPDLLTVAIAVLGELDSPNLAAMVDRCSAVGVVGPVKNLIFGSTRKPDLVLTDALTNDLALLNPDEALIYDGGIPDDGLTWRTLVRWCLPDETEVDEYDAAKRLFKRLQESLGSEPEKLLFKIYASRYGTLGFDQPALVPQVWFHYDPRSAHARGGQTVLFRQRLDFLLLLQGRRRVVIEVDGAEHYSDHGSPSPRRYAEMVREDRSLRLAGYEMYRFGGAELPDHSGAATILNPFFDQLLGPTYG